LPQIPTGYSVGVQQARRIRIKYELITENNVVVRSSEYESFDYQWPNVVQGSDINGYINSNVFLHNPGNGIDYRFKITIRAGKKIGFFYPLD
jgi:hypothetical protein